jgi:2-polyprenyl-6-hydroxyphenyl methylase/3-demethylubiquinone-9 3-methyltransferase
MATQQNPSATGSVSPGSGGPGSTVDPAEIAKFSKLSETWWDPRGKMAPLHKINPLRLSYIRDAACRKFERNIKSLNCLSGLRMLDIGCGAGLLCEPFTRLGAQVIGVDPSASNIAAAKLHAEKGHLSIDYRCTTVEEMDVRERFDIVLAMEVVEHVADVGLFLNRCTAMLKPGGMMVVSTLNRNWKSFALAIVGAEYVLRWLPRGTHQWDKFVTPNELEIAIEQGGMQLTDETGVIYNLLADQWQLSTDMDVNYMVVAEKAEEKAT